MEHTPMRLKRSFNGLAVVAASAAAVLAIPVGPASALVDYTVTSGGSTNDVTATNVGNLVFEDTYLGPLGTAGNPRMTCTTLSADGTVNPGGHAFGDAAGQVTPAAGDLTGCTNPVVNGVTITPSGTWSLVVTGKTATGATGYLDGVAVHLYGAAGGQTCEADATGRLYGTYSNSTGNLVIDSSQSSLVISNVTQTANLCDTVGIYDDDPAAGSGTVHLSPVPTIS
jgi:hypothetical protein